MGNEWTGIIEGAMIFVCVYDVCMCADNEWINICICTIRDR